VFLLSKKRGALQRAMGEQFLREQLEQKLKGIPVVYVV
jgi:hypothetical protein